MDDVEITTAAASWGSTGNAKMEALPLLINL